MGSSSGWLEELARAQADPASFVRRLLGLMGGRPGPEPEPLEAKLQQAVPAGQQVPLPGLGRAESLSGSPGAQEAWSGLVKQAPGVAEQTLGFMAPAGLAGPLEGAVGQAVKASPWHSALRKYAGEKLGPVVEGKQAVGTLRKGATQAEWEKVGLEGKLEAGKKYGKADLLKQIEAESPELKDVVLGEPKQIGHDMRGNPVEEWTPHGGTTKFSTYQEAGGSNYKELFVTAPVRRNPNAEFADIRTQGKIWRDGHADYEDIQNPIVRLRFNDRTGPAGEKVLFLEEMQPPNPENQAKMPAELLKRWREIGLKRAIKYAADGGYDRVAWTTGEMQAARYDLSKHVDTLSVTRLDDAAATVEGIKDGKSVFLRGEDTFFDFRHQLPKELAEKVAGQSPGKSVTYSGLDLKVGGEGLKRVYDADLPAVAKKLGAKVEPIDLQIGERPGKPTDLIDPKPMGRAIVPSIDISGLRQKAVSEGFPIYSVTPGGIGLALMQKLLGKQAEEEPKQ